MQLRPPGFAALLIFNAAGGGNFFFRLAASIAGRMRGGPAKICVIASALYGTLSGSPVSDVVTTGSIRS